MEQPRGRGKGSGCMHGSRRYGRREEGKYIYQKGYQHGQAIQLFSVNMLHD